MVLCIPSKLLAKRFSSGWSFDRAEWRKLFVFFSKGFVSGKLAVLIHCSVAISFFSSVFQIRGGKCMTEPTLDGF